MLAMAVVDGAMKFSLPLTDALFKSLGGHLPARWPTVTVVSRDSGDRLADTHGQ